MDRYYISDEFLVGVTLNGAPIHEDEIPNVLHGAPTVRRYAETVPTAQVGGSSVAQGLGRYLAEMSEEDRRLGFREPSHVRWHEVLEFSRHRPQAWHEVRWRFDRKPRWKK